MTDFEICGHWEPLSLNYKVFVTREHGFTTDTILLANFSAPKKKDVCADFGTGCGTIPIIWHMKFSPKKITGIEIQDNAAKQADISIKENKLDNTEIINADIRDIREIFSNESLDLISCNPPYKASGAGIKNEDLSRRTARHEETLSLDELAKSAAFALKYGGRLCICQRPERLSDAIVVFRKHKLEPKKLRLVQQRTGSAPSLFLMEMRKGGASGLKIEPTLIIEKGNGKPSDEIEEIYGEYREVVKAKSRERETFENAGN